MAAIDESTLSPRPYHQRRLPLLQHPSPRLPTSIDRHFEQYLIDHHHYPKLPSIAKQTNRPSAENSFLTEQDFLVYRDRPSPFEYEHNHGPISRLLNSEQYRRGHKRLIEYRQHSKIPGVALATTTTTTTAGIDSKDILPTQMNEINDLMLPLKEVLIETTRNNQQQQQQQQQDDVDLVDDDSIFSHEGDRRRRAKHWIKEHQFFFTEYQ